MEQADGLSPGSEVHRLLAIVRTRAKELFLGEKIKVRVLSPPFLFSQRETSSAHQRLSVRGTYR
jgi:hypothetical protein